MYQEIYLGSTLHEFVDCAWLLKPDPEGSNEANRVLPDGHTDLVVTVGKGVQILGPARTVRFAPKTQGFLGIRFRLGTAGTLIGIATDELLDQSVSLEEIWGVSGRELEERVLSEARTEGALAILAKALTARIRECRAPDRIVLNTARRLQLSPNARVRELAAEVSMSERQLLRRFEHQVGLSIRRLGRILRFQHLVDEIRALRRRGAEYQDWAGLAHDYGYADQAHLIRDSRSLAGVTPARLVRSC
jgi:AraC-like DNA-binding protein